MLRILIATDCRHTALTLAHLLATVVNGFVLAWAYNSTGGSVLTVSPGDDGWELETVYTDQYLRQRNGVKPVLARPDAKPLTGMPVTLGYVDRTTMTTGLGPTLEMTGDVAADMDRIRAFYADKAGFRPELRVEPRLRELLGPIGARP